MHISAKHVQMFTLTGLMAFFGLTVGFANANGSLATVAQSFVLLNSNGVTEGPFADAKFDIVGYMSHPCFDITGTETESCVYQYGITEPLKNSIADGTLLSWAGSMGLLPVSAEMMTPSTGAVTTPAAMQQSDSMQPTVTMTAAPDETTVMRHEIDTDAEFRDLHIARSNKLWNICLRNDATRDAASLCYQQNIRLLMRLDVEISEDTVQ